MRWLIKPIMRPIARRRLAELGEEQDRFQAAIERGKKAKRRISDLQELAMRVNIKRQQWEKWLT